jgi:hypothetical protein
MKPIEMSAASAATCSCALPAMLKVRPAAVCADTGAIASATGRNNAAVAAASCEVSLQRMHVKVLAAIRINHHDSVKMGESEAPQSCGSAAHLANAKRASLVFLLAHW